MEFFHLLIKDTGNNTFSVSAKQSTSPPVSVEFQRSPQFNLDLQNLCERAPGGPLTLQNQEPLASGIGETLFQAFFPTTIKTAWNLYRNTHARPRLALILPRSLFALPWEVLKDPADYPGKFLSLIGSVVRVDDSMSQPVTLQSFLRKETLKLLAISANPKNRPVLGDLSWRNSKRIKLQKLAPATFNKFKSKLTDSFDYDGLVFWGHGDIDAQTGNGVLLFLQPAPSVMIRTYISDPRDGDRIALVIQGNSPLRIGYILACESASWGNAWSSGLTFDKSIVAKLLQKTPLGLIIGAQTAIDVSAAETYLDDSLGTIRSNPAIPLDLALTEGRSGVYHLSQQSSAIDWWVPAIYVKPECLEELNGTTLPTDPSEIMYPSPAATPTASPAAGLRAQEVISTIGAVSQILATTAKVLFS